MNRLPPVGDGRWRLPRHAHLVVYEAGRFRDDPDDGDGDERPTGHREPPTGDGADSEADPATDSGDPDAVEDGGPDELVTVYDCGAAQKPPSAQFIGHLVRVRTEADVERTETGYVVRLREPAVLEEQDEGRWVVAER